MYTSTVYNLDVYVLNNISGNSFYYARYNLVRRPSSRARVPLPISSPNRCDTAACCNRCSWVQYRNARASVCRSSPTYRPQPVFLTKRAHIVYIKYYSRRDDMICCSGNSHFLKIEWFMYVWIVLISSCKHVRGSGTATSEHARISLYVQTRAE